MTNKDKDVALEQFRKEIEGLDGVKGVAWDPIAKEYVALVEKKKDEKDLDPDQLVANNTSLSKSEHGVVEVGHLRAHRQEAEGPANVDGGPAASHRPVKSGAEEQPEEKPWVGTGSVIAVVTDPSKGRWDDSITPGTVVRLSNWHVYVGDEFEMGRPINHPFRGTEVGQLVGAVPLEGAVSVDVAARTVSDSDGWGVIGLDLAENDTEYGRHIVANVTDDHAGMTVTKSGRTTDVTEATIVLVDASVEVDYGTVDEPRMVQIDDCILTTDLGDGGDSGSAVYMTETGALCGIYFAGADATATFPGTGVFMQIENVMDSLGVEPITDWDPDSRPVDYVRSAESPELQQFKDDLVTFIQEWRPS